MLVGFARAIPLIIILIGVIIWQSGGFPDLGKILPFGDQVKVTRGEVVRAVDGDTLEVKTAFSKETVRLIGIDTPESVRPGVPVECGAEAAHEFTQKLTSGDESVRLESDPTQDSEDRYGRLLAYAYMGSSEVAIQEKILRAGWAEVYVYGGKPFKKLRAFREAEASAREAGLGVWGMCGGDFHSEMNAQ